MEASEAWMGDKGGKTTSTTARARSTANAISVIRVRARLAAENAEKAEGSKKVDKGEDRSAVGNCLVPLVSCDGDWAW
ncbi:hypothetical protein CLOP_g4862 [Closterium sp. NIES-67]|nr:hypothetical protein CLOP_g4862 [Closterium sp. NIES-67]